MCEHGFHWECLFTWDGKLMINILLPGLWESARGGAIPINDWNRIFETCLKPGKCLCLHCTLTQAPPALAGTWAAKRTWENAKTHSGESVTICFDFTFLSDSRCLQWLLDTSEKMQNGTEKELLEKKVPLCPSDSLCLNALLLLSMGRY